MSSAYGETFRYSKLATLFIENDPGKENGHLLLELHLELAHAAYLDKDFSTFSKCCDYIDKYHQSISEKVKMKELVVRYAVSRNQIEFAIKEFIATIHDLQPGFPVSGTSMPVFITTQALKSIKLTNKVLKNPSVLKQGIDNENDKLVSTIHLVDAVMSSLFVKGEAISLFACVIYCMNKQIQHGTTPLFPFILASYGVFRLKLKHYETARKLGELSLQLLENPYYKSAIARTRDVVFGFLMPNFQTAKTLVYEHEVSFKEGVSCGDVFFASTALIHSVFSKQISGFAVREVIDQIEAGIEIVQEMNEDYTYMLLGILHTSEHKLLSLHSSPIQMCGEHFNEIKDVPHMKKTHHNTGLAFYYYSKLRLSVLFARNIDIEHISFIERFPQFEVTPVYPEFLLFSVVGFFRRAEENTMPSWKAVLRAKLVARRLKIMAGNCHDNFFGKYNIVKAELYGHQGKSQEAILNYTCGYEHAKRVGQWQDMYLALYGKIRLLKRISDFPEQEKQAKSDLLQLCENWGAMGLYDYLTQELESI